MSGLTYHAKRVRRADDAMLAALDAQARKPKAVTLDGYTANQMKHFAVSEIKKHGGEAWINNVGAAKFDNRFVRFGFKGCGDVIGILPGGRFVNVEVKTTHDAPTVEQMAWHYKVIELGGISVIAECQAHIVDALLPFAEPPERDGGGFQD